MVEDIVDQWLRDLGQGKVSCHPAQIPSDVLDRLHDEANIILGPEHRDIEDSDKSANAALLALALVVAARVDGGPTVRRTVSQMISTQRAIAVQIQVEYLRRQGWFDVNWPAWGFGDVHEGFHFRPKFAPGQLPRSVEKRPKR